MSVHRSASVFFGTWAPLESDIGQQLGFYIEVSGRAPAPTKTDGVTIGIVGSQSCGPEFVIICAGEGLSFGKWDDVKQPVRLSDDMKERLGRDALTVFFAAEGIDPSTLPPVG